MRPVLFTIESALLAAGEGGRGEVEEWLPVGDFHPNTEPIQPFTVSVILYLLSISKAPCLALSNTTII